MTELIAVAVFEHAIPTKLYNIMKMVQYDPQSIMVTYKVPERVWNCKGLPESPQAIEQT